MHDFFFIYQLWLYYSFLTFYSTLHDQHAQVLFAERIIEPRNSMSVTG